MKTFIVRTTITLALMTALATSTGKAAETPPIPEGFTRIEFTGAEELSDTLNNYLWYHFHHRSGNGPVLFNKEYLMLADVWLSGATEPRHKMSIQEVHRKHLLGAGMDEFGYVYTHQHFSHSHDLGWPFPLWTQAEVSPQEAAKKVRGWYFQELDKVPGWDGDSLRHWKFSEVTGEAAKDAWTAEGFEDGGLVENRWHLKSTEPNAQLTSPEMTLDTFNAPFMQLRWTRIGEASQRTLPYLEFKRAGDDEFSPERRMYFRAETTPLSRGGLYHSIIPMHEHPLWDGTVVQLRITPAPNESNVELQIDSFFPLYDTRHTINNPILILASVEYFSWTGDLEFLYEQINRMRIALRYMQTELGGFEHNHIRNPWVGHGGLPGFERKADGTKVINSGHGIGNNYWDLMPFGWDDFYATFQYYAATRAMVEIEQAIIDNPGWNIARGALAFDPVELTDHAAEVKETANSKFWNDTAGRFIASIDKNGTAHDYGYTFVNLEAITSGIASDTHAETILDWIDGSRTIEGDTSTGADIYHWRFAPRATTKRNIDWYGFMWHAPESIPWGGQVQDGGAVLGFSYYDLTSRLRVQGVESAWKRLVEIMDWEREVKAGGGYREYYKDGVRGTTLQGCGTPGGLGVDCEFYESSLLPAIVPFGFAGIDAKPDRIQIKQTDLPAGTRSLIIDPLLIHRARVRYTTNHDGVEIEVLDAPLLPIRLELINKRGEKQNYLIENEQGLNHKWEEEKQAE